jgi:hypothetical protein
MGEIIQLRNGERIRPEEFPADHMAVLNRNLDQIRDERYTVSEWVERVLTHRASVAGLTIVGAALFGLAAFNSAVHG